MNNYYMHGPFYGIVTDNEDPDKLGRVKVKLEIFEDSAETDWIPVMSIYASEECGAYFIPEVEDQVVVAFLGDNSDQGVVLGSVWNNNQKPPKTEENTGSDLNQDGENNLRFIRSRSGNRIIMDDKDGEEKIQILSPDAKTRFELLAKDKMINIETEKNIEIKCKGKLNIEADEGEFKFKKGLKVEGDELSLKANSKSIEVKANTEITIKGTTVKLNDLSVFAFRASFNGLTIVNIGALISL